MIENLKVIDLPRNIDPHGTLGVLEGEVQVPFPIKRVFYLYDVPGGATRAGHALKTCHQFIVALSGSFDLTAKDGMQEKRIHLNRSYQGIHLPPLIWRELDNFSSGSVCLVLASERYDEKAYFRDYSDFVDAVARNV